MEIYTMSMSPRSIGALRISLATVLLGALCATMLVASPAGATAATRLASYSSTGGEQTYTVPTGVTSVSVIAVGAPGGAGGNGSPSGRGSGEQVSAILSVCATGCDVTPSETLYIEVGGIGRSGGAGATGGKRVGTAGSFN